MSNNGAGLLAGLLIGGAVVGAAMSADRAADRQHARNVARYNRQVSNAPTFCICGAKMVQGQIQQGLAKCNNLNCQQVLTHRTCYYCPQGGNVAQHPKGFFYCHKCANQLKRGGRVIQKNVVSARPAVVQQQMVRPVQQRVVQKKGPHIVKQGYMSKKGAWLSTAYKKRWFKLWSNKKMAYLTHPGASYTKGYADFTKIKKMERKGKLAFEVTTAERVWSFLCQTEAERNHWFDTIQTVCTNVPLQRAQPQPMQQPMQAQQVRYVAAQPMQQPPVQYVQAQPQQPQQVQYVAAQPMAQPMANQSAQPAQAAMMNGNVPYAVQPQPQAPMQAQPQPQQQPQTQYRGSVDQGKGGQGGGAQLQPHFTRPASQSLQPRMVGYNGGDMYGGGQAQAQGKAVQQQKWEDEAPPAYAVPSAPSAPFEADIAPSAPPMEDDNEGGVTGQ